MPDSFSCPARPGAPALPGGALPPEPEACPGPAAAGRTGLPLSIWPGIPYPGCLVPGRASPPCPDCPGPRAWPVITAFSRPGDLVAIASPGTDCATLVVAAASTGRRILGISTGTPQPRDHARRRSACQPGPGTLPGGASYGTGRAALAVTTAGGGSTPQGGPDSSQAARYAACQQVLRPGGVLAVLATQPAPGQVPDLGLTVAAARTAGLVYAQHIILIHAVIDGGQLHPFPGLPLPAPSAHDGPASARIHTDLLVFTKIGGPQ